jgi:DNA topoisomerase-1
MDDAMELFKMPRELGLFEETPLVVNIGRFGPYILHDKKFVSIPKDYDPYSIDLGKAVELVENKRVSDANKLIKSFEGNPDIQVLNGRFGPYIKAGKKNVKIPKGKEPAELTLEECVTLADATPEKKGRGGFARKTTAAATPTKAAKTAKTAKTAKKAAPKKKKK